MAAPAIRPLAEGHGAGAARPALRRLDGEPCRRRRDRARPPTAGAGHAARRHLASRPRRSRPPPASRPRRDHARRRAAAPTAMVAPASANGIPAAALAAYQRAETVIDAADPSCHLTWPLIAAIGRVESDHGRFGGNMLADDGVAQPGHLRHRARRHATAPHAIRDTDAGQYDDDARFDRAVGPMQFIPSTWSVVGVDGDGDGKRNPQDIDDAALATAVYLCSGDDDLATERGPARGGLPLQPQPGLRRPGARPSWRPTSTATTPRCRTAPPRPTTSRRPRAAPAARAAARAGGGGNDAGLTDGGGTGGDGTGGGGDRHRRRPTADRRRRRHRWRRRRSGARTGWGCRRRELRAAPTRHRRPGPSRQDSTGPSRPPVPRRALRRPLWRRPGLWGTGRRSPAADHRAAVGTASTAVLGESAQAVRRPRPPSRSAPCRHRRDGSTAASP